MRIVALLLALAGAVLAPARVAAEPKLPPSQFDTVTARNINADTSGSRAISVKPFWAYFPSLDVIRYGSNFGYTTTRDGESWESAAGVDFQATTGYSRPWSSGLVVAVGDNIVATPSGATEPYTYRVTQAGALGSSVATWGGPGSAVFTSGTAQLRWINYTNLAAKIGFTSTTFASANADRVWGANFNMHLRPLNHQPGYMTGIEQDFYNYSGYNCDLFSGNTCNAYNLFLGGSNRSTVGLNIGRIDGGTSPAVEWGLSLKGPFLARNSAIDIAVTGGQRAIGIGRNSGVFGATSYSGEVYRDEASAPRAISLGGTYSYGAITTEDATITAPETPAIVLAQGQRLCLASVNACFQWRNADNKLFFKKDGVELMSLDASGNLRVKGTITQGVTP